MTPCSTGSLFICLCIINSWTRQKNWEIPRSHTRNSRKTLRKQSTKFCFSLLFSRIHKALSEKRKLIKCFLSNSFYKLFTNKLVMLLARSSTLLPLSSCCLTKHPEKVLSLVEFHSYQIWVYGNRDTSCFGFDFDLFCTNVVTSRNTIETMSKKTATLVKLMVKVRRNNSISRKNYSLSNTSHAHFRES